MCDLSVIIVNWNTCEPLRACLAALPAACGGLSREVLVVDNASSDGSAAMVRDAYPHATLIESGGNLGFARGNNLALPRARGRCILLLNPDTVCEPGALKTLVRFLDATPDAAAVGPVLTDAAGAPTLSWGTAPRLRYHLLSLIDPGRRWLPAPLRTQSTARLPVSAAESYRVEYVVGACLMMNRGALERVGPLDERFFMYFEETDWCLRARDAGYGIYLEPRARVKHLEGRAAARSGDFALAQFQKSYRRFLAKHRGARWVPAYRLAQLLEYGLKGAARRLMALLQPSNRARHAALAHDFLRVAAMQFRGEIRADPPS
ncbi:glycosyltransferase [bacterium]|nr:glycosyltransferase [bacterium]MBU1072382.1 glycosyltransferase [bacterium]MBU1676814.1 glycosyltransferase [bacterium]